MEERGSPAGLRQAPRDMRRRERGRAAPRGEVLISWATPRPQVFTGGGEGAAPPLGFPPQGWRQPLDGIWCGQKGERGEAHLGWALGPICPRVCPLPLSPAPWAPCGGRTSPPRGWSPSTLGPCSLLGQVAPLGGPPGPSRWSRYFTDKTRNFSGDQNRTSHI